METETGTIIDPLDENLNNVDTSYPRIPFALYDMVIKDANVGPSKKEGRQRLEFGVATTEETTSVTGDLLAAGLTIRHRVGITPHGDDGDGKEYTVEQIKKSLASITQAAGVSCTARELIQNPTILNGKIVRVKIGIEKETTEFAEKNVVKAFITIP